MERDKETSASGGEREREKEKNFGCNEARQGSTVVPGILLTRKSSLIHATMPFSGPAVRGRPVDSVVWLGLPRHLYYTTGTVDKKPCLFRPVRDSQRLLRYDLFRYESDALDNWDWWTFILYHFIIRFEIRIFNSLHRNIVDRLKREKNRDLNILSINRR